MPRSRSPVWHTLDASDVCRTLASDPKRGLSERTARSRLQRHGPNELAGSDRPTLWVHLIRQLQDALVLILLGAAGLSMVLGEWHDAIAILVIVVLNAVMGMVQEYRAERSLQMLQRLSAPKAVVIRSGRPQHVESEQLVPGDLILLESGSRVPADCRIVESTGLEVDESPLTGESVPVHKDERWRGRESTELGDRKNMLYFGTSVTRGWARAVVVGTGMDTEVGRIAHLLRQTGQDATPLQKRLAQLGRYLAVACLGVVAIVFFTGLWSGVPVYRMFLTAVSLAVAAIPEGMPAAVTVALALGVQRMARRRAIVRRLPAVETLGCATVICSDKTGTLTSNRMTVTSIWLPGRDRPIHVSEVGSPPRGRFAHNGRPIDPRADGQLRAVLGAAALCNHAHVVEGRPSGNGSGSGKQREFGDPTEVALLVAAHRAGLSREALLAIHAPIVEHAFDSERRMMSMLCTGVWGSPGGGRRSGAASVLSKGAVEAILERSRTIDGPDGPRPLDSRTRADIVRRAERLASQGLRVLAVGWRTMRIERGGGEWKTFDPRWETDLTFGGLVALHDPPRPEVKGAIETARKAGIRTIMLTGDHPATARYIARSIGLSRAGDEVLTGHAVESMSDAELARALARTNVFARVSPVHKLRVVQILKRKGDVIAMTGDGVNDAPAIKEADIGIAMGQTGSDVAREAADMVLADDNFATIVAAIEEGRGIYANIRKFIRYLLTCNMGEILTMFLAALAGWPLPLLPMQILWMNLVTDGLPAMGLGVEKTEPGIMSKPPRRPDEHFFAGGLARRILYRGMIIGLKGLAAFILGLTWLDLSLEAARTLAFTTLVLAQLVFAFHCRSETVPIGRLGWFSNPWLIAGVAVSGAMQIAVVHWPPLQNMFNTTRLDPVGWGTAIGLVIIGSTLDKTVKRARRQIAPARALG